MLDLKFIRENRKAVEKNCQDRNLPCDMEKFLILDEKRRKLLAEVENFKSEKNLLNEQITQASQDNEKSAIIQKGKEIKKNLEKLELELEKIDKEFKSWWWRIPNLTHPNSPRGKDESQNQEIERHGEPPKFVFSPKGHEELMQKLDLIDFERGAKVAGTKFYFLKNEAVFLEQALINFAFEKLWKKGFLPFLTPDLAKDRVLSGIGYSPRGEETQIYGVENTNLNLIGTAEIPMGGYHMDEIIPEEELPLKYVALSHCYRTEAGSYGRHSAGLYRVHQFTKVEMFAYAKPEESEKIHAEMKDIEVEIFRELEVPFRVVDICSGDLGGPAYRKYDLEAWMVSRQDWGEITSTSNTTTYQARRLNIKLKRQDKTKEFLHLLNGTAIAVSRALIALVENHQQADGSIKIPEALKKYLPEGMGVIRKK